MQLFNPPKLELHQKQMLKEATLKVNSPIKNSVFCKTKVLPNTDNLLKVKNEANKHDLTLPLDVKKDP